MIIFVAYKIWSVKSTTETGVIHTKNLVFKNLSLHTADFTLVILKIVWKGFYGATRLFYASGH